MKKIYIYIGKTNAEVKLIKSNNRNMPCGCYESKLPGLIIFLTSYLQNNHIKIIQRNWIYSLK